MGKINYIIQESKIFFLNLINIVLRKPKKIKVDIKSPFFKITGEWEADENEQLAAWELYVELVTRIAVEELKPGAGLLHGALSSLYEIFGECRTILRKYGPVIAMPKGGGALSLGTIAITVLNSGLRPVLTKWHPLLSAYESKKSPEISATEHEAAWENNGELRKVLNDLRQTLEEYSYLLAEAAGIPPIKQLPR